jgi:hypothetical protein
MMSDPSLAHTKSAFASGELQCAAPSAKVAGVGLRLASLLSSFRGQDKQGNQARAPLAGSGTTEIHAISLIVAGYK